MPRVIVVTLGCKVNQYESERIASRFVERGFDLANRTDCADVVVVNTCSVTETAERKSRQAMRRMAREHPGSLVVATGCLAELARRDGRDVPEAALLVPNDRKLDAVDELLAAHPGLRPPAPRSTVAERSAVTSRTRATVKVQDGCDLFCTFCSIPYSRSRMLSRPAAEVLDEVRRLVDCGVAEVVVTGVLVGSYGPATGSGGPDLPALLRQIARVPGLRRVRLSSIEPVQVSEALLRVFSEEPTLCHHLHIPLQSGDDGVLTAMNRPYRRDDYLRLCDRAQSLLPDVAITADILVGFPGETRSAFENTMAVARTVGFARAHVFRYSPRPGTPAADRTDGVPEEEKTARSEELIGLCRATQRRFVARYLGRELPVLVEGKIGSDGQRSGYTENYIRVCFPGAGAGAGEVRSVRLLGHSADGALGELAR
jgi:threonylcarbamoyladenosine tRNA methylthiotransferase MtaB